MSRLGLLYDLQVLYLLEQLQSCKIFGLMVELEPVPLKRLEIDLGYKISCSFQAAPAEINYLQGAQAKRRVPPNSVLLRV